MRSPSAAVTTWQKILDEIAAGTSPPPPHVRNLALGVAALDWRERSVAVEFDIRPEFCVEGDTVFGGYVAGIHDEAAGFAMYTCLPDDRYFATKQLRVDFRAPTRPGLVRALAEVESLRSRTVRVRVRVEQAGTVTSESVVVETTYPAIRRDS
jgi:uncharacterized protein (TIGR00369 family)